MSYVNRLWVAASVAVVNSHSEQGQKLKSGLKSLNHGKKRFFSGGGDAADVRPFSSVPASELGDYIASGGGEDKVRRTDESLRSVMYLNCWGQS